MNPRSLPTLLGTAFTGLRRFFAAVPGALKNHLNYEELVRISVTAATAGGGVFTILQALVLHSGEIFPAPTDAALATAILTMILEAHRRLSQGTEVPAEGRRSRPAH